MIKILKNLSYRPFHHGQEHSVMSWCSVVWEVDWKHAQSQPSEVHDGSFATKELSTGLNLEHQGSRCKNTVGKYSGVPTTQTPGQLIVGEEHKLRRSIKSWLPYQQAAHLLGDRQKGWIIFNQEAHFFPCFLCFFLFSLFTIRVVYHSLACFAYLDYPHSLFFIGLEKMSGFSKAFGPWNACRLESKAPNHS